MANLMGQPLKDTKGNVVAHHVYLNEKDVYVLESLLLSAKQKPMTDVHTQEHLIELHKVFAGCAKDY